MPESQSNPAKPRKRRSSATRFLRSAVAAGFSVNSIEFDPNTGKFVVSVDKPAAADTNTGTAIETAEELKKLI